MELIITEKRNMALLFARTLGDTIKSKRYSLIGTKRNYLFSSGHIINLSEKIRSWDIDSIIRITEGRINREVKDPCFQQELESIRSRITSIVVATDYDLEGEVIGRDIVKIIGKNNIKVLRWKFSSLVPLELKKTYLQKVSLDTTNQLYYKGEARRTVDFIDGISATKFINLKRISSLSEDKSFYTTGRVKAALIRLLQSKDQQVQFNKENKIVNKVLKFTSSGGLSLEIKVEDTFKIPDNISFEITQRDKTVLIKPPQPYNTKRLIAKLALNYTSKEIKEGLEYLYQEGIITYPRTDTQLFDNNLYQEIMTSSLINSSQLCSKDDFNKISIGNQLVDHPAISPTFKSYTSVPLHYLKFTRNLLTILTEPLLKIKEKKVTATQIKTCGLLFSSERKINLEVFKKEIRRMELGEKRIYIEPYTLSTLLAEMSKNNIGTKATQLPLLCDFQDRKIISADGIIVTNKSYLKTVVDRLKGINLPEPLFKLSYCTEIHNEIDQITKESELKNIIKKVKDKWKRIAHLVK